MSRRHVRSAEYAGSSLCAARSTTSHCVAAGNGTPSPCSSFSIRLKGTPTPSEPGYLTRVTRFRALGHEFTDFRVHAPDVPKGFEIDGLLGLSFLRHFNYESVPKRVAARVEASVGAVQKNRGLGGTPT